jgi:hypothetical protein
VGLGQAAIGVGATVLAKALSLKVWKLHNHTKNETVEGQFAAEDVEMNVGGTWNKIQALNRQSAFLQFINGTTQTLSVHSRFFRLNMFDDSPVDKFEKLAEWCGMDAKVRRPPLLTFSLGDGLGLQRDVLLVKLSGVRYGRPNALGGIREVEFTMEFIRWSDTVFFNPEAKEVTDTRYARVKQGEYQELLAAREYGDPMVGVVLRQDAPDQALVDVGSIVKLPSSEGVRFRTVAPDSIPLKESFGSKDTPQKTLLEYWFKKRSLSSKLNYRKAGLGEVAGAWWQAPSADFSPYQFANLAMVLDASDRSSFVISDVTLFDTANFASSSWTKGAICAVVSKEDGIGDRINTTSGTGTTNWISQTIANSALNSTASAVFYMSARIHPGTAAWLLFDHASGTTRSHWINISTGASGTKASQISNVSVSAADASGYRWVTWQLTATNGTPEFTVRAVGGDGVVTNPGNGIYFRIAEVGASQPKLESITSPVTGAKFQQTTLANQMGFDHVGLNGKPTFRSYAQAQFVVCTDAALCSVFSGTDKPWTLFWVGQQKVTSGTQGLWGVRSSSTTTPLVQFSSSGGSFTLDKRDDLNSLSSRTGGAPDATIPHVFEIEHSGTAMSLYRDGTLLHTGNQDVGQTTLDRFILHALTTAGVNCPDATSSQWLLYARQMTAQERKYLRKSLGLKWSTTV